MSQPRAALVVHPLKHADLEAFRAAACAAMTELGWADPLWLETKEDDTGERLARQAAQSGLDLVLACGGDGTVTACAAGVAGSGVPLGVLPSGTGNLLARNLGLPLALDEALTTALTGADRRIDIGAVNGRAFVVMAGLGFDAQLIGGASEQLKRRIGSGAYVVSALRHLRERPVTLVLRADGGPPQRRRASAVIVGNVGTLQGNIALLPDARPDDGVLDIAVLAAHKWAQWLRLAADLLLRRKSPHLVRLTCRDLTVQARRARPWQADGEISGWTRQLTVSLQPGAVVIRVPPPSGP